MTTANEALQKYLEALSNSYELLGTAASSASERGTKVSRQFAEEIMAAQKDALALARKVSADPDHALSSSYASFTEAAVSAQTRALTFAQLAYAEAVSANAEGRELGEKIAKANQATADAAVELTKSWAAFNPMAELFVKTMEAGFQAAGAKA